MRWWTVLLAVLAAPALSMAQVTPAPAAPVSRPARGLDPSKIVTLTGTVTGEKRVDAGGGHSGVHIVVKTAEGEIPVHLGPDTYVDKQPRIARGDAVTVKGFRLTVDDRPAIVAQTVTVGGKTITFREPSGAPAWAGSVKR